MPLKKLLLASDYNDKDFENLLSAEGYSVIRLDSGEAILNSVLAEQPDLLILYGPILRDMSMVELAKKVVEDFPIRTMRLIFMHYGTFVNDDDIKWDDDGFDVALPYGIPYRIFLPVLRKVKDMGPYS